MPRVWCLSSVPQRHRYFSLVSIYNLPLIKKNQVCAYIVFLLVDAELSA